MTGQTDPEPLPAKPALTVRLAAPRGFCAGVERAIRTVEESLAHYGAPVYVRHEIVHNKHVVDRLTAMGAVFVDQVDEVEDGRPVIFSAHGAPKAAHDEAAARDLKAIDATCPLVLKVHTQTRRFADAGRHVFLIGHANHPEVIGTMGQAPDGSVTLIESIGDVETLPAQTKPLAYVTQTTLSVDDTRDIISALQRRFPEIVGPSKEDICYATSNRQAAVKATAPETDLYIVIGSQTSSNSKRLIEVAKAAGAASATLIDDAGDLDWPILENAQTIGVSAGASAPEFLVEELLEVLAHRFNLNIETVETARENIVFNTPMRLAS